MSRALPGGGTLIFDGDCALCKEIVTRVRRFLPVEIAFRAHQSFSDDELAALGTTRTACTQRVQFVQAAGAVSSGGAACVDLLARSRTPLRRLAPLARLSGLRTLIDYAYDRVAANRATISRLLLRRPRDRS